MEDDLWWKKTSDGRRHLMGGIQGNQGWQTKGIGWDELVFSLLYLVKKATSDILNCMLLQGINILKQSFCSPSTTILLHIKSYLIETNSSLEIEWGAV